MDTLSRILIVGEEARRLPWTKYASILLVDSDHHTRQCLEDWLPQRGFELSCAGTAEVGLSQLEWSRYDLVILAMVLSDRDGLSVCRDICRKYTTPVVMVSSSGTAFDEVAGLEAGADDFLVKPLKPEIMLARIRSLLRRSHRGHNQDVLTVGDLVIDRPRLSASLEGRALPLTPTEFKILTQLALVPGTPLSRDALLSAIWNTDYVADKRLVDTHVRNLRRKLREVGSTLSIYGVRGIGYRLASDQRGEAPVSIGALTSGGVAIPGSGRGVALSARART